MIQESLVDRALNRLSAQFGPRVIVRPPASAADLAEIEALVGPLPRDLKILLSTCDGLRLHVDGFTANRHLWSAREIREALAPHLGVGLPDHFVPVRGEPDGVHDGILLAPGPLCGAVIRCDALGPGAALLASSFGAYLDGWTRFLVDHYDRNGQPIAPDLPRLNADWMCRYDESLIPLVASAAAREALAEIDRAVATGDDFE